MKTNSFLMTNKLWFLLLFNIGLLLRITFLYISPNKALEGDEIFYSETAMNVANGIGIFGHNYISFWPPLYSCFLGILYKISSNYYFIGLMQSLLNLFSCFILFLIGRKIFNNLNMFFLISFFIFYPEMIKQPSEFLSEDLFIFLFLTSLYFIYVYVENLKTFYGIIAGILIGLSSLTREIALYFIPFLFIWMFFIIQKDKKNKNEVLKRFLIIFLSTILTIFPWTLRNYFIFREIVPISTNIGVNLLIGNNPNATGEFMPVKINCPKPKSFRDVPLSVVASMEYDLNRIASEQALDFIKSNPLSYIKLCFKRLFLFWSPPVRNINIDNFDSETLFRIIWLLCYLIVLFTGFMGIIFSIKEKNKKAFLIILIFFYYTGIHMLTVSTIRYRLPLIPLLMIFSNFALIKVIPKLTIKKIFIHNHA